MRENKFRARTLDTVWIKKYTESTEQAGGFIIGSLLDLGGDYIYIVLPNEYEEDRVYDTAHKEARYYKVERETVGQYTGLKDKNGTEIYEGDIVSFTDILDDEGLPARVGIVGFSVASFRIERKVSIHYRWMDYEVEVIGNIHQNPELLEVTANA